MSFKRFFTSDNEQELENLKQEFMDYKKITEDYQKELEDELVYCDFVNINLQNKISVLEQEYSSLVSLANFHLSGAFRSNDTLTNELEACRNELKILKNENKALKHNFLDAILMNNSSGNEKLKRKNPFVSEIIFKRPRLRKPYVNNF
ncbi:unnamed protein product [Blepharisma stoltei]|uniref:Uncharacterized protein n=1 Tax=Blepharisma stoltei TaxID=1481888 RepID=A0AAU9ISY2_9CILI|nr:unnamed protein product [Blepharisma stoltei]